MRCLRSLYNRKLTGVRSSGAAYAGTAKCVDALLDAGANAAHISAFGGTTLIGACANMTVDSAFLGTLVKAGAIDVNKRRVPRTRKAKVLLYAFESSVRRGVLKSEFALDMAHTRHATALHQAAQVGNTAAVVYLLSNGARPSIHAKNAMRCTPLDVARVFGPFPELEMALVREEARVAFETRFHGVLADGTLVRK